MKVSEMRGKDTRELALDLQALHKELFGLRFRAASEEVAKTARFREIRRTVARIKTVMRERDLEAQRLEAQGSAGGAVAPQGQES